VIGRLHALADANNRLDARAVPLAELLERLLRERRRALLRELAARYVSKADPTAEAAARATELVRRFGLAQIGDAGQRVGTRVRGTRTDEALRTRVTSAVMRDWIAGVADRLTQGLGSDEARTRAAIFGTIQQATLEDPRPSDSEIARRIRAKVEEQGQFSFERSMRIARTELAIADSAGTVEGYRAVGVERIRWLAYKAPIWPRRHDRMDGQEVELGGVFVLPSGARMRYPHDPAGPVGEIVNCRCSTVAVRAGPAADREVPLEERRPEALQDLSSGRIPNHALDYLREGMRRLDTFRSAFEGRNANAVATGRAATDQGTRFDPIKVTAEVALDGTAHYVLTDGRHRLAAAREAGATEIRAEIRVHQEQPDGSYTEILRDVRVIPIPR